MDSTNLERKQRLKILLENLQKDHDSINGFSIEDLNNLQTSILNNDAIHQEASEAINELLKNNTEILLDAQVLKSLHEIISKVFKCNTDFNSSSYAAAVKSLIGSQDQVENWSAITDIAMQLARTTAMKDSMYSATEIFETLESTVKERRKRSALNVGHEKRPESLNEAKDKESEAEKTNIALEQINELFKANNYQPIPFYKLIIDPNSFSKTVHNAFQLSFLVRDGNLSLDVGSDTYPEVHYVSPEEAEGDFKPSQAICSLSVESCNEMAKFYDIKEAMLNFSSDFVDTNRKNPKE